MCFHCVDGRPHVRVHALLLKVVVTENETLRRRVTKLNAILQSQGADHASAVHNMNSDRFNIRLQLEQVCPGRD